MISTPANNVIDFVSRETLPEIQGEQEISSPEADLQIWSALTLGSLQKQLTGHEDDPRFSAARSLVDHIAAEFSTANPIDIADYFEAIEALAVLKAESLDRLDEIGANDPLAA